MLDSIQPPLSHIVFGAGGGFLYILRQHLKRYKVQAAEYVARPIFGAVSAFILTVAMQLPNHLTSLFVGYFGIDIWDTIASRFEGRLPLAGKHEAKVVVKPEAEAPLEKRRTPP